MGHVCVLKKDQAVHDVRSRRCTKRKSSSHMFFFLFSLGDTVCLTGAYLKDLIFPLGLFTKLQLFQTHEREHHVGCASSQNSKMACECEKPSLHETRQRSRHDLLSALLREIKQYVRLRKLVVHLNFEPWRS
jgi:hypothetical protein